MIVHVQINPLLLQKPTDLLIYTICKGMAYPGSAGPGLNINQKCQQDQGKYKSEVSAGPGLNINQKCQQDKG